MQTSRLPFWRFNPAKELEEKYWRWHWDRLEGDIFIFTSSVTGYKFNADHALQNAQGENDEP